MSDRFTLVRYTHSGDKFEILVDPDKGLKYKRGELTDVSETLVLETIYSDSKKGEKASREKLEAVFNTSDPLKVAEIMFEKGVFQLTSQQRKELTEQKFRQVITFISRNFVDPRTKLPHPITRIENAFNEARISIDPFKSAEEQVKDVVNALRPILPMSVENIEFAVKIPPEHASKAYGVVKNIGEIKRDEWQSDGSWISVVVVPAAMQGEFLDRLGKVTQGNLQTKILK